MTATKFQPKVSNLLRVHQVEIVLYHTNRPRRWWIGRRQAFQLQGQKQSQHGTKHSGNLSRCYHKSYSHIYKKVSGLPLGYFPVLQGNMPHWIGISLKYCVKTVPKSGWYLREEGVAVQSAWQDSCSSIGRYSSDSKCGNVNTNAPIENVISEPPITFALHFRLKYCFTRL